MTTHEQPVPETIFVVKWGNGREEVAEYYRSLRTAKKAARELITQLLGENGLEEDTPVEQRKLTVINRKRTEYSAFWNDERVDMWVHVDAALLQ